MGYLLKCKKKEAESPALQELKDANAAKDEQIAELLARLAAAGLDAPPAVQ